MGLSQTVLAGAEKRFIFLYHDISDPGAAQYSPLYSTPVRDFHEQIEFLARNFQLVALPDIVSDNFKNTRRLASITFDDGFLSVREQAWPYLSARGIPFALFVNGSAVKNNYLSYGPGHEGISRRYTEKVFLDADDVKVLDRQGVLVGSHSTTHRVLSECTEAELNDEIVDNKIYLEELLHKEVRHMALPFGKREHYNASVLTCCRQAGHDFVYLTNPSFFVASTLTAKPLLLPRIGITNETIGELTFLINRPLVKTINI